MTLRLKLTIGSIVVILLANALLSLVIVGYLERTSLKEVQNRVQLDLNSAQASYAHHIESIARYLTAASLDDALAATLKQPEHRQGRDRMVHLFRAGEIDFLTLLDAQGRTVFRPRNPSRRGDDQSQNPLVQAVLETRQLASGTILLPRQRLVDEGEDLAARTDFEIRPTPSAPTGEPLSQREGMVAEAAAQILGPDGNLLGVLVAGNVLDRRYALVDGIREQVFPETRDHAGQRGNVTIFRGDLRIATNVIQDDGSRAVGTRMSSDVFQRVLVEGSAWSAPAFVVHDWYITAYEPIRDPRQRVIGALYVGLLRAPFLHRQNVVTAVILLAALVATVGCLLLVVFITALVLRPIDRVVAMAHRVIAGDLSARTGIRPPGEMGFLCEAIDRMAAAVAEREAQLKAFTRQQMGKSEKLASIGRLAAGVAHEINNPLTGVLTFAHLLRDKPKMDDEDKQDLDLIIHETTRAAEIVRNLLDFARERAAIKERLSINDVVLRVVRLIRNQKGFDRIRINDLLTTDLPEVDGNMNQLQQVLLNLSLNACEAMPKGGTITIKTFFQDDHVFVEVIDTGCGIKREHLDQLFEPFFTTKPVGKGTGLGLAVSFGIIEQHRGTLEVQTEEGKGSTFRIKLPQASGRVI